MLHKDKSAEHKDCKVHNFIIDQGKDAVINLENYKICR